MPSNIFYLGSNIKRASAVGTLKSHVFQQMRDTVIRGVLISRSGIDPNTNRDALDRVHSVRDNAQITAGDLCVYMNDNEEVCGICDGYALVSPAEQGYAFNRCDTVRIAWRVPNG